MKREKEIKHISETVYGYMQEAYDEGFEDGVKTTQECSWEKGVRDAWDYLKSKSDEFLGEDEVPSQLWGFIRVLHDLDPVIYTKGFVEERNKEELAKTKPIEVGDVVIDADGKERVVIHISEDDFVYAINIKDSNDLLVEIPYSFKKTGKKAVVKVFKPLAVGELK
jgi:hypothetical protein